MGYSYSTISRVPTGKAKEFRISDETAQVIIGAEEKLNYRPNILARSLRLKKQRQSASLSRISRIPFLEP